MTRFEVPESPEPSERREYYLRLSQNENTTLEDKIAWLQVNLEGRLTDEEEKLMTEIIDGVKEGQNSTSSPAKAGQSENSVLSSPNDFFSGTESSSSHKTASLLDIEDSFADNEEIPTDDENDEDDTDDISIDSGTSPNNGEPSIESDSEDTPGSGKSSTETDSESNSSIGDPFIASDSDDPSYRGGSSEDEDDSTGSEDLFGNENHPVSSSGSEGLMEERNMSFPVTPADYSRLVAWQVERHKRWAGASTWENDQQMCLQLDIRSASELLAGKANGEGNRKLNKTYCAYSTGPCNWGPPARALIKAAKAECQLLPVKAWMVLDESQALLNQMEDWYFQLPPEDQEGLSKDAWEWNHFVQDDGRLWHRAFRLCD